MTDRTLKKWRDLPFIVSWGIWRDRNEALFQDKGIPSWTTILQVEACVKEYTFVPPQKNVRQVVSVIVD